MRFKSVLIRSFVKGGVAWDIFLNEVYVMIEEACLKQSLFSLIQEKNIPSNS